MVLCIRDDPMTSYLEITFHEDVINPLTLLEGDAAVVVERPFRTILQRRQVACVRQVVGI